MSLLILAILFSSVLVVLFSIVAHTRLGPLGVCSAAVLGGILSMCLMSGTLLLQSFVTLLLAAVCALLHAGPRAVSACALAAAVLSFAVVLPSALQRRAELAQLRHDYPFVDLSDRLAYENAAASRRETADAPPERLVLARHVASRLAAFEADSLRDSRANSLRRVHERGEDEFAGVVGFGPIRMIRITRGGIELPAQRSVPLPEPDYLDRRLPSERGPLPFALEEINQAASRDEAPLWSLHSAGAKDFLNARRMGYVASRDRVAGFQSHGLSTLPAGAEHGRIREGWQVTRLDLVSLLRHEIPLAYVSENLPQMDELRDAPTRPLDDFEAAALPQLRADEDVVIKESEGMIQMLGSLRAGDRCLECHSVERGDLLGALSYRLTRAPLRAPKPHAPPREDSPVASIAHAP